MKRSDFLNRLLSLHPDPRYLEIGVHEGETFFAIEAARKVAVDPAFQFDVNAARDADARAAFHLMPSDAYFGEVAGGRERFDVIFIDGLHTFEQTLRDLINATAVLQPQGVIVIDDVLPNSEMAALKDFAEVLRRKQDGEAWDGSWMGDVYRLVFFIESFMQPWSYRCVGEPFAQLAMWREQRQPPSQRPLEAIATLPYAALPEERAVFRHADFETVLKEVAASLGLAPNAASRHG